MKRILSVLFALIIISVFIYIINSRDEEINKVGLEDLNLKFSGIVTEVEESNSYNGYGIIRMKILSSNIAVYDPRDTLKFYYCVIKNNIAEVYGHAYSRMIGDTLNVDTHEKIMSSGSIGNEHNVGSIRINSQEEYYQFIQEKTKFKR